MPRAKPLRQYGQRTTPVVAPPLSPRRGSKLTSKTQILSVPNRPQSIGNVLVMGSGECGQLGKGESIKEIYKYAFVNHLKGLPIVSIVAGGMHNLALAQDGTVYSWGCNDEGALGRTVPTNEENDVAVIPNSSELNFVKLAAGDSISLGLTADGKIYGWGTFRGMDPSKIGFQPGVLNAYHPTLLQGPIFSKFRWVDIATGNNHALALTSTGIVFGWGNAERSQCGFRTHRPFDALNPRPIYFGSTRSKKLKIYSIGCGGEHSFAIDEDGDLWSFGLNNYGQCGRHPSQDTINPPMIVPLPDDTKAKSVCGGEHFSLVLLTDGRVVSFGKSVDGQLGLGDMINIDSVSGNLTSEQLIGQVHTTDGQWFTQEIQSHIYRPTYIPQFNHNDDCKIVHLSAGASHAFAIDNHGRVWRWGFNEMGQCGTGDNVNDSTATDDVRQPIPIDMTKSGSKVIDVACGAQHSVLLIYTPPKPLSP